MRLTKGLWSMGEKVEDLGEVAFGRYYFIVDANLGHGKAGERDIHIQNKDVRLQIFERDYVAFLSRIISANSKVLKIKDNMQ